MDRVNPWSLEHLLFCWPARFPASSPCPGGVGLPKTLGLERWGECVYSEEPCSVTAQTRGMPETLGYRCQGALWYWGRGTGAARWEQQRMAKDPQGCVSHFFTQMITEIKSLSSRPESSDTERAYSSSSVNLKLFLLLNSPLLCLLGSEGEDTDMVFCVDSHGEVTCLRIWGRLWRREDQNPGHRWPGRSVTYLLVGNVCCRGCL